jgi:hypothetical protein
MPPHASTWTACGFAPALSTAYDVVKWLRYDILRLHSIACPPQPDRHQCLQMQLQRDHEAGQVRQHLSRRRTHTK